MQAVFTDVGGSAQTLWQTAQQLGVTPEAIWLTHGHLDHAGGVADMRAAHHLPVIGPHSEDAFWLDALPEITANYGFPPSPAISPDQWLEEGDTLQVGQYSFEVLHIPGHTPGHVVFYQPEAELLIAGDVLFRESIGRTDFPKGNHADLIHHIRHKLFTLPETTQVIPGHGSMTTIGHEKRHNPFLR